MKIKRVTQDCPHTVRKIDQTETHHAGRATQATVYAGRSPVIGEDGYWYEWSDEQQAYIKTKTAAGVTVTQSLTSGTQIGAVNGTPLYAPATTDVVEAGNRNPVSSAGVFTVVGNIQVLLSKI